MAADLQARIQARVKVVERGFTSPCWISDRTANRAGYTKIRVSGRTCFTHRVAYEAFVAPVADDLQIDHLCRQRACCNPEHLEPVTARENLRRSEIGWARLARSGVCKHGHEMVGANVRINGRGARTCRSCQQISDKRRRAAA